MYANLRQSDYWLCLAHSNVISVAAVSHIYASQGYFLVKQFASQDECDALLAITGSFHKKWLARNHAFYQSRAINSSGLTEPDLPNAEQRAGLFRVIGSGKLVNLIRPIFQAPPVFVNTQLFFDPTNAQQTNYWHRDIQYDKTIEEQKQALNGPEAIHCRLALKRERGIELIPGSHRRWDRDDELDVRLGQNGRHHHEALNSGVSVALNVGDMLVFSAAMIHRGLYGLNRMALDILFCENAPQCLPYINHRAQPGPDMQHVIETPSVFASFSNTE